MTKFIVVGVQRSGTTLIRTTLNNHSQIRCAGESFKVKRWRVAPYMGDLSYQKFLENRSYGLIARNFRKTAIVQEFLDDLYGRQHDGAIGFKFMADQHGRFPAVVPYIKENSIKVIHVTRENTLKIWVSILTAKARGGFHSDGGKVVEAVKVHVPISGLLLKLNTIYEHSQLWTGLLSESENYTKIKYEHFVKNKASEVSRLCEFLNVGNEQAESELKKMNSDDLCNVIENYEQVCSTLKGSRFEWCTH